MIDKGVSSDVFGHARADLALISRLCGVLGC